jgi:hypothetical protein
MISTQGKLDAVRVQISELAKIYSHRPDDDKLAGWLWDLARERRELQAQLSNEFCEALYGVPVESGVDKWIDQIYSKNGLIKYIPKNE